MDEFGETYFETMKKFRIIVLQDLAFTADFFPDSIFAKHSINTDNEFVEFRKQSLESMGPLSTQSRLLAAIAGLKNPCPPSYEDSNTGTEYGRI